jgi:hypothetical protein
VSPPPPALVAALSQAVIARSGRREGHELRFLCPAHQDHHPSARWNPDKHTWFCDACKAGGGWRDLATRLDLDLPAAAGDPLAQVEATYDYCDAEGRLLFQVLRKRGKKFACRRPLAGGGWTWRLAGVERVLYRLPETLAAVRAGATVFVVEGEKDADRLAALGLAATTNPGGAGKWRPAYNAALRGARVLILPDHDATGRHHAESVRASLSGIAGDVRLLELPGLVDKGDVSDWLAAREREGLSTAAILIELETLAKGALIRGTAATRTECCTDTRPGNPLEAALAALRDAADAQSAEGPLRQLRDALRGADELRRATVRERAIAALADKVSAGARLVDSALALERSAAKVGQGQALEFPEPEPWPDSVDCASLLQDIADTLSRYVALPPYGAVAMALWVIHAYALDAASVAPILALTSPEKRCGKTTSLSLLARLVPRPLISSNISPAALFRTVEKYSPTLLVDEADTVLHEKEELRCILNSSHTRDAASVVRTVGDEYEPRRFSTWSAKVVALIGRLPDTLADRSIIIPMRRRASREHVERLRLDLPGAFEQIRRRATRWSADHLAELRSNDPEVPAELSDRAADNWRPLLAIADLAGGEWPRRARQAALAHSGAAEAQEGTGEQLLADIRAIVHERGGTRIFTDELLPDLTERDDLPWREWRRGNPLTAVQLAKLLKPFGIRPRLQREGDKTGRGYLVEDFADAFARYLPADPLHPLQGNADTGLPEGATRYTSAVVTGSESGANPDRTGVVTGVTGSDTEAGWMKV